MLMQHCGFWLDSRVYLGVQNNGVCARVYKVAHTEVAGGLQLHGLNPNKDSSSNMVFQYTSFICFYLLGFA